MEWYIPFEFGTCALPLPLLYDIEISIDEVSHVIYRINIYVELPFLYEVDRDASMPLDGYAYIASPEIN